MPRDAGSDLHWGCLGLRPQPNTLHRLFPFVLPYKIASQTLILTPAYKSGPMSYNYYDIT